MISACLSAFPLKKTLCSSSIVTSPKFFHLISQNPRMFHLYLSFSFVSSWSFLAALSVLVFHVHMVMLPLLRIFDDAPVAYFTSPSWCTAEGAVLVDPGGDRPVWYGCLFSSYDESRARYNLTEPIPQDGGADPWVEHVAIELTMEPFRSSGPCLRSMKICAQ